MCHGFAHAQFLCVHTIEMDFCGRYEPEKMWSICPPWMKHSNTPPFAQWFIQQRRRIWEVLVVMEVCWSHRCGGWACVVTDSTVVLDAGCHSTLCPVEADKGQPAFYQHVERVGVWSPRCLMSSSKQGPYLLWCPIRLNLLISEVISLVTVI